MMDFLIRKSLKKGAYFQIPKPDHANTIDVYIFLKNLQKVSSEWKMFNISLGPN